jgi:hypothetical protein
LNSKSPPPEDSKKKHVCANVHPKLNPPQVIILEGFVDNCRVKENYHYGIALSDS